MIVPVKYQMKMAITFGAWVTNHCWTWPSFEAEADHREAPPQKEGNLEHKHQLEQFCRNLAQLSMNSDSSRRRLHMILAQMLVPSQKNQQPNIPIEITYLGSGIWS